MRKLIASTFVSLDGVMQAPGGPTEDPTGNFTAGGWVSAFGDPEMDISSAGFDGKNRDIILGRKTYDIFEAYWPYQSENNPIAKTLNAAKKYVASRTLKSVEWNNSSLLGDDIISAIPHLKHNPGKTFRLLAAEI
jgi:dihydrofolate reductase